MKDLFTPSLADFVANFILFRDKAKLYPQTLWFTSYEDKFAKKSVAKFNIHPIFFFWVAFFLYEEYNKFTLPYTILQEILRSLIWFFTSFLLCSYKGDKWEKPIENRLKI